MRPRPVFNPTNHGSGWVDEAKALSEFREEERAWFEEVLMHPLTQAALKIPEDEPIFVLRAQDKYALDTVWYWLQSVPTDINTNKLLNAANDYQAMQEWQKKNPDRVKVPD